MVWRTLLSLLSRFNEIHLATSTLFNLIQYTSKTQQAWMPLISEIIEELYGEIDHQPC